MKQKGISVTCYRATYALEKKCTLPAFLGDHLRKMAGSSIRSIICKRQNAQCQSCPERDCLSPMLFAQGRLESKPFILAQYPFPDLILEKEKSYKAGDILAFDILLIGEKGKALAPYFISAISKIKRIPLSREENIPIRPVSIRLIDLVSGEEKPLADFSNENPFSFSLKDSETRTRDWNGRKIRIRLLSYTRLKGDRKLLHKQKAGITFLLFFCRLLRRLSNLEKEWDGGTTDRSNVVEKASDIAVAEDRIIYSPYWRDSGKPKIPADLGGFLGEIVFEGDLKPFIHYLDFGRFIHIGNGCSMGFGKYETPIP